MTLARRIHPTRYGQVHVRSNDGRGVPLAMLHASPRSGAMWEPLQARLTRPGFAPDRLGYGFSDAPPWAMSLEQCAQSTVDALMAAGIGSPFDLIGMRTGSIEAIEIACQFPEHVRRVIVIGLPLFSPEEHQRQLEKYSEQPLRPVSEGGHLLGAWRGCFAYRAPPYDLGDVHMRFIEHVLAAHPGAALKATAGFPIERRLRALRAPLIVLAPHDDIAEQTARVCPLLRREDLYLELPDIGPDPVQTATDRLIEIIHRHAPA